MSTHSIASACTQNLAQKKGVKKAIAIEAIANLYAEIGCRQVIEMSARAGAEDNQLQFFFDAFIFGFCPSEQRFIAFVIVSSVAGGEFHFNVAKAPTEAGRYLPIGSGEASFVALMDELRDDQDAGVMSTLREMVRRDIRGDVGGHLQIGVAKKSGFQLVPVLDTTMGPNQAFVSFLGWDATSYQAVDGYQIGFSAIRP